jgi:AcrR family transcriptional regulator
MAVRLTRRERSAAHRTALLDAARRVFLAQGYHGASVDAVAREAGFTIGAVYSQFGSKAELFLALLEQRVDERIEQIRSVAVGGGVAAGVAAVARQWAGVLRTDLDWTLLVIEFRVHAARDPALAARFAEVHGRLLRAVVRAATDSLALPAPLPQVEDLARVLLAMGPGGALARAAEGEAFRDELMEETTVALAERLLRDVLPADGGKEQP